MRTQGGKHEPELKDDATNLTTVVGSAALAVLATAGLLWANQAPEPVERIQIEVRTAPAAPDPAPAPEAAPAPAPAPAALAGNDRLYGTVTTRDGYAHRGYIRWDKNEGSWADLLDANKLHRTRSATQAGIRFGHVARIDVTARNEARFTMKSGETFDMGSRSTDLGSGLRALEVVDPERGVTTMQWRDLESVEFEAAPEDLGAAESRLYGTLTTRSGLEFTGHITWDVDEIYSTDVLDGDDREGRRKIPFGSIARIDRYSGSAARVVLRSGEETVLRGTNDVDDSNNGISVSDAGLGQVMVQWDDFESVRFHEPEAAPAYGAFDGGTRLRGTVVTRSGRELTGTVVWDHDESHTWEMLNGVDDDLEFQVEFSNIARIERSSWGARVELRDGRVFELEGSNDVDDDNRGILIDVDGQEYEVEWDDFQEFRLTH